ncbi:MAG: HAD hydrolase family protein [Candidatus Hodarchaeota archaeon]
MKIYSIQEKKEILDFNAVEVIKLIVCDHDHTLTRPRSQPKPLQSKFLSQNVASILPNFLLTGPGIVICSTSSIPRLIKQYFEAIKDLHNLEKLILIAETGGIFAIPERKGGRILYKLFLNPINRKRILECREQILPLVEKERSDRNSLIFVNNDLYTHITIENFTPHLSYSNSFIRDLKSVLENYYDDLWIQISESSSIEINYKSLTKALPMQILLKSVENSYGDVIALGDSEVDEPLFKQAIGFQIFDKDPDQTKFIKFAKYAILDERAGNAAATLFQEILKKKKVIPKNVKEFNKDLFNELKKQEYKIVNEINPQNLMNYYTFPSDIKEKCERLIKMNLGD